MSPRLLLATLLAIPLSSGAAHAAILRVPAQYPTIGQALAAAGRRDTILVAPGTYQETITWPSKYGIRLIAEQGASVTTIDACGQGRVITFGPGLDRATLLQASRSQADA